MDPTTLILDSSGLIERVLASVATLVLLWLLRMGVLWLVQPRLSQTHSVYLWRKGTQYAVFLAGIVGVGQVWWSGFSGLATFLGLLSAGVAVALRDWIANAFGWLYLVTWRPYSVGDRIEVGGTAGDVIDIGLFATALLEIGNWVQADQSTGRVLYLPNALVMSDVVHNYSTGLPHIWDELRVLVTFESDWRAAKGLLAELANDICAPIVADSESELARARERWLITYSTLTPIVYTRVEDSGVALTLRYLSEPRRRRGTAEQLWEAILDALAERPDIELAYRTWRVYDHSGEGGATRGTPAG